MDLRQTPTMSDLAKMLDSIGTYADGFSTGYSTLSGCVASNNTNGFRASQSSITNCQAYQNTTGFDVAFTTLTNSLSYNNSGTGVDCASGGIIHAVHSDNNTLDYDAGPCTLDSATN